jgi:FAD/FMN-containing dehydrogenase
MTHSNSKTCVLDVTCGKLTFLQVKFAHVNSIPFVCASGGHSPWSTIDNSGFVLDLGLLNAISIDSDKESVTISGAVLIQELAGALEQADRCTSMWMVISPSVN